MRRAEKNLVNVLHHLFADQPRRRLIAFVKDHHIAIIAETEKNLRRQQRVGENLMEEGMHAVGIARPVIAQSGFHIIQAQEHQLPGAHRVLGVQEML